MRSNLFNGVNRDYTKSSDSIVKIFDERIEFYNPGCPPEELTVTKLKSGDYISYIRNIQIAYLFKEAGLIEKYGSGIKRIFDSFKEYELPQPKIEIVQKGFRVTIFKTPQKTPQKRTLGEQIVYLLSENERLTQKEIAERLSISFYTVKEYFVKLKKERKIERVGSDKGGFWKVIEISEGK